MISDYERQRLIVISLKLWKTNPDDLRLIPILDLLLGDNKIIVIPDEIGIVVGE